MFYNFIQHLEIELTTKCNASCPQCVRNYFGGRTWETLPLVDINLDRVIEAIDPLKHSLSLIRLCGTYGDPCIYPEIKTLVKWLHANTKAKIVINTNASMHTTKWWADLGAIMRDRDLVYFGIDGLEDTHRLYRRGTDYNKIIQNLRSFNQAGGRSVWSFIVFEHNQHQVEQARQISQELGCAQFTVKSTGRFVDKSHRLIDRSPVMDRKGSIVYWLKPVTDPRYINNGYQDYAAAIERHGGHSNYLKNTEIRCLARNTGMVYLSAEGYVLPCGMLADRFYGFETENHPDHDKLFTMIDAAGGLDKISIYHRAITDIVNDQFFQTLQESWKNSARLDRCANQCSVENTIMSNIANALPSWE